MYSIVSRGPYSFPFTVTVPASSATIKLARSSATVNTQSLSPVMSSMQSPPTEKP